MILGFFENLDTCFSGKIGGGGLGMKAKKYTHGRASIIEYFSIGVVVMLIIRFLYACGEWIAAVIQKDFSMSVLEWEFYLLIWIFLIVWTIVIIGPILNIYSKFILTDEGIHVRMFNYWFFWKFIPWENVKSFEPSPSPRLRDLVWLLRVDEELTIWHRRLASMYSPEDESVIIAFGSLVYWKKFKFRVKKYLAGRDETIE